MEMDTLPVQPGSLEPALLRVCGENNDYSLLGEELEQALAPLQETEDKLVFSVAGITDIYKAVKVFGDITA